MPQHRKYIYMVAFRKDYATNGFEFKFSEPPNGIQHQTLNDIREQLNSVGEDCQMEVDFPIFI